MITLDKLKNSLVGLSPTAQRLLLKKYYSTILPADEVLPSLCMLMWTADMLANTHSLDSDQRNLVIDTFSDAIQDFGCVIANYTAKYARDKAVDNKSVPVCRLGFADQRYVFISGKDTFLDLISGEEIPEMRKMPLREVYYNLTTLYMKHKALLAAKESVATQKAQ